MIFSLPTLTEPTMSTYEDQTLDCRDCHEPFLFDAGEQEFFAKNNFPAPIRCKSCRQKKKAQREKRQ